MPIEIFNNINDGLDYLKAYDEAGDFLIFLDINFPEKMAGIFWKNTWSSRFVQK